MSTNSLHFPAKFFTDRLRVYIYTKGQRDYLGLWCPCCYNLYPEDDNFSAYFGVFYEWTLGHRDTPADALSAWVRKCFEVSDIVDAISFENGLTGTQVRVTRSDITRA